MKMKMLKKGTGNVGGKPKVKAKPVKMIGAKVRSDVTKSKVKSLASRVFSK